MANELPTTPYPFDPPRDGPFESVESPPDKPAELDTKPAPKPALRSTMKKER